MEGTWRIFSRVCLGLPVLGVVLEGWHVGGDTERYIAGADALIGRGPYAEVPYPPGFPVSLAPMRWLDLPVGSVTVAWSIALMVLTWAVAVHLSGPIGGVVAGLVLAMSPIFIDYGALIMSDAPATALLMGGLLAGLKGRWWLCGVLSALSAWVRLSHALFVVTMPRRPALVGMAAALVPLAVLNLIVYGALAGYDSGGAEFSIDFLTGAVWFEQVGVESRFTNLYLWPMILLGRFGLLVPLLPVFAATEFWRRRKDPATRLAVGIVVVNLLTHWFYFFQSVRFVLPAAAVLVAYAAAALSRVLTQFFDTGHPREPRPARM